MKLIQAPEWLKTVGRAARYQVRLGLLRATAKPDLTRTLTIFGSRRSGTTWLFEMLMAPPGIAGIFEPFHPILVPEAGKRGLDDGRFIMPGTSFEHEDFVRRVLEGRVRNDFTLGRLRPLRALRPRHLLVKFVRANALLPWIVEAFPLPPAVFLIRHPCAVVASLIRLGGDWVEPKLPPFPAHLKSLEPFVQSLDTPEERCAAVWALENRVALGMIRPARVRIVSYERLYSAGPKELEPILSAWNLPTPKKQSVRFRHPSTTTQPCMYEKIRSGQGLGAWRDELGTARTERVLAVVRRFGFNAYSEEDMPDEQCLLSMVGRDRE